MSNLNIPPPSHSNRPVNVYEWLGLTQKIIKDMKGVDIWNSNTTMTIKELCTSLGNDFNFKQTMFDTIEESFNIAYTPENILKKIKTVDGIGSGLDSDFVRGYVPINKAGDNMTGFLSLHDDPKNPLHAVTKNYVDGLIAGLVNKAPVRVATTENIELVGFIEIDGIPISEGDRVLVKNQTDKKLNGIYIANSDVWARSADADNNYELRPGTHVFVNEGLLYKDSSWVIITDEVDLDVTDIEFTQFSGAGQIIAGTGLSKDGNRLYITDTGIRAGKYTKLTVDAQGRAVLGENLTASDIPTLDWSKITTGKPTTVQGYGITNAVRTDVNNIINANIFTMNGTANTELLLNSTGSSFRALSELNTNRVYLQSGTTDTPNGELCITGKSANNLSKLAIKVNNNNATINDYRILTLNDLGSGKGIDADKLDGLHGSSYMRTDVDTFTDGYMEIRKSSTVNKSALSIISSDTSPSAISLIREGGADIRSWQIKAANGHLIFGSKLVSENSFSDHIKIDTNDKEIYVKGNIAWNAGNDGSGSGLDADLLDGQHGEYYRNASNINAGTLNNSRLHVSVFRGDNGTYSHNEETQFNHRRSGFKRINGTMARIHWANPINNGDNSTGIEISHGEGTNSKLLKYYKCDSTGAKVFDYEIWHKGQQGHGTGMDADTIDGKHLSDLTNLYVNRTGDNMVGFLKLHADPTDPLHATTKQYVDGMVQGLDYKQSVKCASIENITNLKGLLTIDGVVLHQGDRILVKNQTNKAQNGIYNAQVENWIRTSDANNINKLNQGTYVFIDSGNVNGSSGWVVSSITTGDIGVSEITFIQFSGAGQILAGTGLGKNGNEIYLKNTGIGVGTYTKLTIDAQGRATSGTSLSAGDIPGLDWSKITTGKPTTVQGYGITNAVRTDTGGQVNGPLSVSDNNLRLQATTSDHAYMGFYPRNNSNTRGGYIGYGVTGTTTMTVKNIIGSLDLGISSYETNIFGSTTKIHGNLEINKVNGRLTFRQPSTSAVGKETGIDFISAEGQNISIEHVFFNNDTPCTNGNGIRMREANVTNPGENFFLQTMGEIYAGRTGLNRVWHAGNFNPGNYLLLSGGTMTGKLLINHNDGILVQNKLNMGITPNSWVYVGATTNGGNCNTRYKDNGHIEFYSGKYDKNGLLYNNNKVWHADNDGSGSGLDADLLDGANSSVAPSANTIPKRGTDGSVEATTTKTNKIELGGKAEIVFNSADNSIDFIIK